MKTNPNKSLLKRKNTKKLKSLRKNLNILRRQKKVKKNTKVRNQRRAGMTNAGTQAVNKQTESRDKPKLLQC